MDLPDYIQSLRSALLVYHDKYDTQLHYSGGDLLHYQCNLFGMLLHLWAVHHTCMPEMEVDLCQRMYSFLYCGL